MNYIVINNQIQLFFQLIFALQFSSMFFFGQVFQLGVLGSHSSMALGPAGYEFMAAGGDYQRPQKSYRQRNDHGKQRNDNDIVNDNGKRFNTGSDTFCDFHARDF